MKTLVLFDFDETLTTKDTLFAGIKAVIPPSRFKMGMKVVSFFMPHFKKKRISSTVMKTIIGISLFRGLSAKKIESNSRRYLDKEIIAIKNNWHYERFGWHQQENHDIVIISANFDLWVKQWAEERNVPVICTILQQKRGKYTGFLVGKNNYDDEKIHRLKALYNLESYDEIYAYTDSLTDKCLLDAASKGKAFLNGEVFLA